MFSWNINDKIDIRDQMPYYVNPGEKKTDINIFSSLSGKWLLIKSKRNIHIQDNATNLHQIFKTLFLTVFF